MIEVELVDKMQVYFARGTPADPAHGDASESRHFFRDTDKFLTPARVEFDDILRLSEEDHQFVHEATSQYNPSGKLLFSSWGVSHPRELLSLENTHLYTTIR